MTAADFTTTLATHGLPPLARARVATLQLNVGKLCNQACHHCHVDAGPTRTERMGAEVGERVVALLARNPQVTTLDVTGGAPELNPHFRRVVVAARALGRRVIDRCNLTVLALPEQPDLAEFLAAHDVDVVASLPCYGPDHVDAQRGRGVFDASIAALRRLNALGYGSSRRLDLVYNPLGPTLPPPQAALEADYRRELGARYGIVFHRLLVLANMPIARFAAQLARRGDDDRYLGLLVNHFNAATVPELMCRHLVSVAWDGTLHDCDFNQMLALPAGAPGVRTIWDVDDLDALTGAPVAVGAHCHACTAGGGSSCGGALA
jgi:radical SAM/Cys-rich protein